MRVVIRTDGRQESFDVSLSDNDERMVESYLADHDRLVSCGPLQKDVPSRMRIDFDVKTGVKIESHTMSSDEVAIVLHRLRPFLLQDEPASFVRTKAMLGRRVASPVVRTLLSDQQRLWDGRHLASLTRITINQSVLADERLLLDWLNGTEFHRDSDKQESISRLRAAVPAPMFDWIIESLVLDKIRAIANIAKLLAILRGIIPSLSYENYEIYREGGPIS